MTQPLPPSEIPTVATITTADLRSVLIAGAADFRRAPLFGLFFSVFYVLGGITLVLAFRATGQSWWAIPFIVGFPLLAPFAAVGLYEVSRALDSFEKPSWGRVLGVVFAQRNRQIPSMAVVVLLLFMFWVFVGHSIFALFMGMSALTNITSSYDALLTSEGVTMLVVGTIIGGGFSMFLFCITVVSLPLLLDREVDFVTAMITSFACVLRNPVPMLIWAFLVGVILLIAMVPAFLGLIIAMPVLGHASWHLYRKLLP